MSTRSDAFDVAFHESVRPASRTASVNGEQVDRLGARAATPYVQTGAINGVWTPKLQHRDATSGDGSTWVDVPADDYVGTFEDIEENAIQQVGYRGTKRYLRVVVTATGSPTATFFSAGVVLSRLADAPFEA